MFVYVSARRRKWRFAFDYETASLWRRTNENINSQERNQLFRGRHRRVSDHAVILSVHLTLNILSISCSFSDFLVVEVDLKLESDLRHLFCLDRVTPSRLNVTFTIFFLVSASC